MKSLQMLVVCVVLGIGQVAVVAHAAAAVIALVLMASISIAEEVSIPDPNLEAAIREAIGKPTGPITEEDLQGITSLEARERGIEDLTGLEHCTNLQTLWLGFNQIADVSALSGLSNLQYLSLPCNQVTNASPLSGLSNLRGLHLGWNLVTDISPLSGLNNLRGLNLGGGNQITDVSPLSGLSNLEGLDLAVNRIADISPLSGLSKLRHLTLGNNQISDISALSELTLIGERDKEWWRVDLDLSANNIANIQPLVDNPGLDSGDVVDLRVNPLSEESLNTLIPLLEERGVIAKIAGTLVKLSEASAAPGDSVTIPINVSNASGIAGANLDIEYDAEVLTIGEVTTTDLSEGMILTVNTTEPGVARIALAGATGIAGGSGALVNIGFEVAESAVFGTVVPLRFSTLDLRDELGLEIGSQSVDGSLTVTGILGDLNEDGDVNSGDAILVLRISVRLLTPTPYQQWAGDVNEDGVINSGDAILILRKAVGLPSFKRIPLAKALAGIEVSISDATAYPGEEALLSISVSDATGIAGGDLTLTYNPDVLTVREVKGTPLAAGLLVVSNASTPGEVKISLAGATGLSGGSGSLIEVTFDVREDAEAGRTSPLRLMEVTLMDETGNPLDLGTVSQGMFTVAGVSVEEREATRHPEAFALSPCYPNPFNPSTTIRYQLPEPGEVKLALYDLLGQQVRVLVSETQPPGSYRVSWDGGDGAGRQVSSGVYLYRLEVGEEFLQTRKMVVVR